MASRSPVRSTFGDDIPPMRETEFHGGLPKSPMRDRFLNDLGSPPNSRTRSRDLSMSPIRDRGSGDFGQSPKTYDRPSTRDDDVDVKSPMRESDITEFNEGFPKSPMRDRFLNDLGSVPKSPIRSPMRDRAEGDINFDGRDKSPVMRQWDVRSSNVNRSPMREKRNAAGLDVVHKSPMRRDNADSEFDENEEAGPTKLTVKSSFSAWLTNDENTRQSDDKYSGRKTWRDQNGVGFDEIREVRESIDDPIHGTTPTKEMLYQGRFRGDDVGGYSKSKKTMYHSPQTEGNKRTVAASSSRTPERASNYFPNSVGNHRESRRPSENMRGATSIQDIAMKRAELLRRYEELGNQLGNLGDSVSSAEYYSGSNEFSEDGVERLLRISEQQFVSGRGVRRDSYFSNSRSPVHNIRDAYDVHPHYDYRNSGQMMKGPHPRNPHRQSYVDEFADYRDMYTNDCQGEDLSYSLPDRRSTNLVGNPRPSHSMNLDRYNPRHYDPRMAHTSPRNRQSQLLAHRHHRRSLLAANPNICIPVYGGAPFITCHKCFRLLMLPRKVMVKKKKKQYQLKCGACSFIVSIDPHSKSFIPFSEKKYEDSNDAGIVKALKESSLEGHRDSYDFDAVGNSFQSIDSELSEGSKVHKLGTNLDDKLPLFSPTSSRSSKEDRISDNMSVKSSLPNSSEMPLMTSLVPPPPGSPLRDVHNPLTYFQRIQAGEVIIGSGKEKQEIEEDGSLENTIDATEMEVHPHEEPPTSFSQDPEDFSPEENEVINNRDEESYETGPISQVRDEIYVNGQLISENLAKKAEKFAGPIQPGEYWYDSKAGFWGPMGHRCMGIIPPSIQEFRFSMPANCSRGDTAIYVNGRELHRRDVHILDGRGLPGTRNKRYIIDFYGRVIDEQTKEFVVSLGKLAPTVEREKLGFGMKIPRDLDDE